MRRIAALAVGLLLGASVLAVSGTAAAENIDVIPPSYDFGDVDVGTQDTVTFTIEADGTDIGDVSTVYSATIADDPAGAFAIIAAPPMPVHLEVLPTGPQSIEIVVEFAPAAAGPHGATLAISSTHTGAPWNVALTGNGVEEGPSDPLAMIEDTLDFFDASVAAGTLEGTGRCWVADYHLAAERRHIERAGELVEAGMDGLACFRLWMAYLRSDGDRWPPDFVTGPASAELASRVLDVMDALGCP